MSDALNDYNTGLYTIKDLSTKYGMSVGKMYYSLRNAGCQFIRTRRHPEGKESFKRRSEAQKGKKITEAQKKAISERNSCNYNGLNGYGHTKKHNHGYLLAYAPKHPHAHKDGYVMLHTIIFEQSIGRYLTPDEVIHHINHDRADNRLENLRIMTKKEHSSMHMKERHEQRRNALSIA